MSSSHMVGVGIYSYGYSALATTLSVESKDETLQYIYNSYVLQ